MLMLMILSELAMSENDTIIGNCDLIHNCERNEMKRETASLCEQIAIAPMPVSVQ